MKKTKNEYYSTVGRAKNAIDILLFGLDKNKYRNYSVNTAGINLVLIGDRSRGLSLWLNIEEQTKEEIKKAVREFNDKNEGQK